MSNHVSPSKLAPANGPRHRHAMKHESNAARASADPTSPQAYVGPDRRRHRVYLTRNTEYHVRDGTCVAVRSRRTGEFLAGHLAINHRMEGALAFFRNGALAPNPGEPRPGESLCFGSEGRGELVTSPLEAVERPAMELIGSYPTPEGR